MFLSAKACMRSSEALGCSCDGLFVVLADPSFVASRYQMFLRESSCRRFRTRTLERIVGLENWKK